VIRILHTSDWHLGQTLRDIDRTEEHRIFLQWLGDLLQERHAAGTPFHATLVAGDIFDGPNPSARAQGLFYDFVERVRHFTTLIVTAGNHDSAERIQAPASLLQRLQVHVVGAWPNEAESSLADLVVPVQGDGEQVFVLAMPFLRLGDLGSFASADAQEHFVRAHRKRYQQLLQAVLMHPSYRKNPKSALIGMGHCFAAGSAINEETERRVGAQDELPIDVFPSELIYVALGHLHKAQRVGGTDRVRYSGSPIPLGFSEIAYPHQVLSVSIENGALVQVESIAVPRPRAFLQVPAHAADWSEVETALAALEPIGKRDLQDPLRPLLEVRVLAGLERAADLRERVQLALADKWPMLFRIDLVSRNSASISGVQDDVLSLEDLTPEQVFRALCAERGLSKEELATLQVDFQSLLTQFKEQGSST